MKEKMARLLALMFIVGLFAITPASAASYDFSFPSSDDYVGSMRYSDADSRSQTGSPYVRPSVTTIQTMYLLMPVDKEGEVNPNVWATNVVYATTGNKSYYFTWKSGYGGKNSTYKLAGAPDPNSGTWNPYTVKGSWLP